MASEIETICGFLVFIALMMAIDLGLFGKSDKPISIKQAGIMSMIWVSLAIIFYFLIYNYGEVLHNVSSFKKLEEVNRDYHHLKINTGSFTESLAKYRKNLSLEFITGYIVEYALSVDNIFVMILIFAAFGVEQKHYHKVLLWGIIGAVLMRFLFIFIGATLISRFHWVLYLFGLFLVYTGAMMFINRNKEDEIDPQNHSIVKFASKYFAVSSKFHGGKFFVRIDGRKMITPLFLVLLIIEVTDLVFAVDSIPAIFSVTKDPYIVFFSNIFAILGLRSMFFLLVNIIDKFHYLKTGLSVLLSFIGLKMLAGEYAIKAGITNTTSLIIIAGILGISIAASLIFPKTETGALHK